MKLSVGVFINDKGDIEKLEMLAEREVNCHLAFMRYDHFIEVKAMIPVGLKVSSLHGFNADKDDSFRKYIDRLKEYREFMGKFKVDDSPYKVVVHPNKFGAEFKNIEWIYPEVFGHKQKKKLRSPLDILREVGRITLDTSHLDVDWLQSEVLLRSLIRNADLMHLSQKLSNSSLTHHKPIGIKGLVPIGVIIRALRQTPLDEVILEYMPEYFSKAIKDYFSLAKTLGVSV